MTSKKNKNNYCIIMAGGFGSRFWPMSKSNNPKQFIDVLGTGQSMLQDTFGRFERICPRENILVVTSELYAERVREQIPNLKGYQVLCEPTRRNTAPCIAYAAAIINKLNPNANVIVSPSDHAIFNTEKFVKNIEQALMVTKNNDWIVTIGAHPNNPNTKYGYIQFDEKASLSEFESLHKVITFTEKPPLEMAKQFISSGEFFWNSGIFVWRMPVLMAAYRRFLPWIAENFFKLTQETSNDELERTYSVCEAVSVDIGIMEKADNVHVMESAFGWSDVETWDSLYSTSVLDRQGNALVSGKIFAYETTNCVIHIPQDKTVVLQGLDGYIVASDENTLLVCKRDKEDQLFKYSSDVELFELTRHESETKNTKKNQTK